MSIKTLILGLVLAATTFLSGCLAEPYTGSYVVVDFLTDLVPSAIVRMPDGRSSHYEMWVAFSDAGVISLGAFSVDVEGHVLSYPPHPDYETRIGSVTGADDQRRSGVEWDTEYNLSDATSAFVTIEANGETDISPSGVVIMEGPVGLSGPGTLRGEMTGRYTTRLGEVMNPTARVTIVIAEDQATF